MRCTKHIGLRGIYQMRKVHVQSLTAVVASALLLSMSVAPGMAFAASHGAKEAPFHQAMAKDHGRDSGEFHGKGHGKGPFVSIIGVLSNKAASDFEKQLSSAVSKYNPLIVSEEAKVATDLTAASNAFAASASTSTTATAVTASEQALEQQITSLVSQMQAATTQDTLASLTKQLQHVIAQLQRSVRSAKQQENQNDQQDGKTLTTVKNDITRTENNYANLYANVETILTDYANGTVKKNELHPMFGLTLRYEIESRVTLNELNRMDAWLVKQTEALGGSTTSTVDPAKSVVNVSSSAVTAGQSLTITGSVYDATGNVVANTPVVVTFDGQSVTVTSDVNGVYSATITPTVAVMQAPVVVTADGTEISTTSDMASVTAATAAMLKSSMTTAQSSVASAQSNIVYTVTDAYGNPVSGVTVDFNLQHAVGSTVETTPEATELPGALSATSAVTNASGQVTVTYTASATADGDQDFTDTVIASVPNVSNVAALTNSQAIFMY